jgi:hypothetical protein
VIGVECPRLGALHTQNVHLAHGRFLASMCCTEPPNAEDEAGQGGHSLPVTIRGEAITARLGMRLGLRSG